MTKKGCLFLLLSYFYFCLITVEWVGIAGTIEGRGSEWGFSSPRLFTRFFLLPVSGEWSEFHKASHLMVGGRVWRGGGGGGAFRPILSSLWVGCGVKMMTHSGLWRVLMGEWGLFSFDAFRLCSFYFCVSLRAEVSSSNKNVSASGDGWSRLTKTSFVISSLAY